MNGFQSYGLFTDLYELTMAAVYYEEKMFSPATFSLFIREYPQDRAYFVSAGLEEVLHFLEAFHFGQEDLDYLETLQLFTTDYLHHLAGLRFSGEVYAMPEGRLFFKDEPVLEVTAPIIESQLMETFVINAMNIQVNIATKASRCVHAARGRRLVDFSLRRTQGTDAGMKVARASYLAGFAGTSNVLAGKVYGIPVVGTMAHSYIMSFEKELEAFRAFARVFPDQTVLLIDTYDNMQGAEKAATVAKEMALRGQDLRGVRLDSGDMAAISKEVHAYLRSEGLEKFKIFASGGFDEFKIDRVIGRGAKIDAFGVGTKMGVSADAPYMDSAYKLVEIDGRPVLKLSTGKRTLVGKKQVWRTYANGKMEGDTIAMREEQGGGEALLAPFMQKGERVNPSENLETLRQRFEDEFASLPERYKSLKEPPEYPVGLSRSLRECQEKVVHRVREKELGES